MKHLNQELNELNGVIDRLAGKSVLSPDGPMKSIPLAVGNADQSAAFHARANFVRAYEAGRGRPEGMQLDPVLKHHLGLK